MSGAAAFAWEPDKGAYVGRDAPRRRRLDDPLVQHRGLLRLPPDEQLGGGRQDLLPTSCATTWRRCSPRPTARPATRPPPAGALDLRPGRRLRRHQAKSRSTTWTASSRASIRACETCKHRHGWYAADPARRQDRSGSNAIAHIDLRPASAQVYELDGGDATSRAGVRAALGRRAGGRRLGDRGGLPRPARTAATSLVFEAPGHRQAARSPRPSCRAACRSASTATGSAQPPLGARSPLRSRSRRPCAPPARTGISGGPSSQSSSAWSTAASSLGASSHSALWMWVAVVGAIGAVGGHIGSPKLTIGKTPSWGTVALE